MINVLHLYYDLLNLYGENANTRCIKRCLELNNIKVNVDLKSINDKIDFDKYDLVYIGSGSEEDLLLAQEDINKRYDELKKYIEDDKFLILTGNAIDLFGEYIETDKKIKSLGIFKYHTKFISESTFDNASTDRIVGEVKAKTKLIKEEIIGFQNRCDINYNIKTPLFKIDNKFSNNLETQDEGFNYKNVYATHIIGPLLIRNPHFTDFILSKLCKSKKIEYKISDELAIEAYNKFINNSKNKPN